MKTDHSDYENNSHFIKNTDKNVVNDTSSNIFLNHSSDPLFQTLQVWHLGVALEPIDSCSPPALIKHIMCCL